MPIEELQFLSVVGIIVARTRSTELWIDGVCR